MYRLKENKKFSLSLYIYIYIHTHTYSALQKYWICKDKIALLAVESRHLQIWLKDEYDTKLENYTFYYWVIQHKDVLPDKKFSTLRVVRLIDWIISLKHFDTSAVFSQLLVTMVLGSCVPSFKWIEQTVLKKQLV